jgi:hypothetical protein
MASRRARSIETAVIVLIAVAVVVFVAIRLLDRPAPIDYARLVDQQTLALGTVTGPGTWTRVTQVQETPDSVVLGVSSLQAPLPGTGDDMKELIVHLSEPIGDRPVIDANTGLEVPKTTCPPPAYLAPGCTQP